MSFYIGYFPEMRHPQWRMRSTNVTTRGHNLQNDSFYFMADFTVHHDRTVLLFPKMSWNVSNVLVSQGCRQFRLFPLVREMCVSCQFAQAFWLIRIFNIWTNSIYVKYWSVLLITNCTCKYLCCKYVLLLTIVPICKAAD